MDKLNMKLEEAITKRIYALCEQNSISPNKLATLSGLPSGSIKSIFYGKSKNPGTRTILDMCQALNITLYNFFNDDLFVVATGAQLVVQVISTK